MDIKKTWLFTTPIAHRGLHNASVPENSLKAFENAVENNYPIELDVRLIDDETVVVFHDEKISRLTQKDGYTCNLKKEDLPHMNLVNSEGRPTEWCIPTFAEVLELVAGRVPILIETKNQTGVGPLESKVLELLSSYRGEYAVQSFNPFSMEYFKKNAFEIPRGQLSAFFTKKDLPGALRRSLLKKLKLNKYSQPDFISYQGDVLPNKWVTKTNLPVLAWTVRSNADMEKVMPYCDNIIFENFIPEIEK